MMGIWVWFPMGSVFVKRAVSWESFHKVLCAYLIQESLTDTLDSKNMGLRGYTKMNCQKFSGGGIYEKNWNRV